MDTTRSACSVASSYLIANADALVESWIDWVKNRIPTSTVDALPERAIRNHIPPILLSIARYIDSPEELARQELLGHLKLHGQIRRDQGFTLPEMLSEFDGLAEVTTRGVNRAIDNADPEHRFDDRLDAGTRLAYGLRSISYIAAGTYAAFENERARSIASGQEEILRAIAHELSNPLTSISLNLDLLEEKLDEESSATAHLGSISAAVERANHLLQTIRTVAVAEGARSGEHLVGLNRALLHLKTEFQAELADQHIEWRMEQSLPDVRVETAPLYIAASNLITNAIKYADPGKDERWISISARFVAEENDTGFCELTVADNGIGIGEEYLARVSQKGFRAHPEVAHGTGHGLYLTQTALVARGGSLTIESEEMIGTTVRARLRCLSSTDGMPSSSDYSAEFLMGQILNRAAQVPPDVPADVRDSESA